jgi:hypothetical protein
MTSRKAHGNAELNSWQADCNRKVIRKNIGIMNITIRLDKKTIQKVKALAARRSISISDLLARQIEILATDEEAYEQAERRALALLEQGFHLGGTNRTNRDDLHER